MEVKAWRRLETAPKGRPILLLIEFTYACGGRAVIAAKRAERTKTMRFKYLSTLGGRTHWVEDEWMVKPLAWTPMPKPPQGEIEFED